MRALTYTIKQLADLSGVSVRMLRYYDEIGLLTPKRQANGYRIYTTVEIDRLQQIGFYRTLGFELSQIKALMNDSNYDPVSVLTSQLTALQQERQVLDGLIDNVQKSLRAAKGALIMTDQEKFEALKQQQISENQQQYGGEIEAAYGQAVVAASNEKFLNLSQAEYDQIQTLTEAINVQLKQAFEQGDPASTAAQAVCQLHEQWLRLYWPTYSKAAHLGLAQMYLADPRFKQYYDKIEMGCAEFLVAALQIYLK